MTTEKFNSELAILKKFFQIYCQGKQHNLKQQNKFKLCDECFELLEYSIRRLEQCPYDIKPRCRTCATPCYESYQWKKVSKIMRYSGMNLGIKKIKNFFVK